MDEVQWSKMERRIEDAEEEIRGRVEAFDKHIITMTRSLEDIKEALLGDIRNQMPGLIASHRQLQADFATFRADLIRWKSEAAEPAIRDVFRFKVQVGVITSVIVIAWTVLVKVFWH